MVKSKVCAECGAHVKNMSQHWYRMHKDLRETIPAIKRSAGFKSKAKIPRRQLNAVKEPEPESSSDELDDTPTPTAIATQPQVQPTDARSARSLISFDSWDGRNKGAFKKSVKNLKGWFAEINQNFWDFDGKQQ